MKPERDAIKRAGPVDKSGQPRPLPPPMMIWVIVALGLLMLAAVAWMVFG
ncbi:hypothetical protein [Caulobacter sp. 17J80-11]|nr:hypothetical protein [Caulobacter sp. 17J80-11]MBC6983350.1 hypothetical protein [Caulobacter sp. 17J80-11]